MSLRVAFIGASGVGKTTLMEYIARKYELTPCPVGSRSVAKEMGFKSPYDVDAAGQRAAFQQKLFEDKCAWEQDHESFVTDRTPLDNLGYATMHGAATEFEQSGILEYVLAMTRYTHVVYVPLHLPAPRRRSASPASFRLPRAS